VQSSSYTVTSDFMRHWKKVQPKMKVSAGYEFVEWAQGADLNNNEELYKGFEWDTTEGEDHNEYKYQNWNGALIVTESLYTIKQLLNGKATHIKTWKFAEDDRYNKHWDEKIRNFDIVEGDCIPYIILGKTPAQVVIDYLKQNHTTRYVQLPQYVI
jgi:hypothetical protein